MYYVLIMHKFGGFNSFKMIMTGKNPYIKESCNTKMCHGYSMTFNIIALH